MGITEQSILEQGFKVYVRNYIENGKSILTLPKSYLDDESNAEKYHVKDITVDESVTLPMEDSLTKVYSRFSKQDDSYYLIQWYPPENYVIIMRVYETKKYPPILHFSGKVKTMKKFLKVIADHTEF